MALVHRAVADPAAQHHAEDHLKDLEEKKKTRLTFLHYYDKNLLQTPNVCCFAPRKSPHLVNFCKLLD